MWSVNYDYDFLKSHPRVWHLLQDYEITILRTGEDSNTNRKELHRLIYESILKTSPPPPSGKE
jgi:hypothetical protein